MKRWLPIRVPESVKTEWKTLLVFGLILIVMANLFFEIIETVFWDDPLMAVDRTAYRWLQDLRTPLLDGIMTAITQLGDTWVVIAVTAAVATWLAHKRLWRVLIFWLTAVGSGSLINSAIKLALQRARPGDLNYDGVSVFSFPSGHSTTNAVLYGFLLIIVGRHLRIGARVGVAVAGIALIGLIGFSRLYLGAHWVSDVVGGLAFGAAWLALLGIVYTLRPGARIEPTGLLWVAFGTLAVAGGINILLNHSIDLLRYAV